MFGIETGFERRSTAAVLPFPETAGRRARPAPRNDEPRGEILFFTGVRYERPLEPHPPTPHPGFAQDRHHGS